MAAGERCFALARGPAPEVASRGRYAFILKPVLCRAGMLGVRNRRLARLRETL
jgi:hypothetical protein